MTAESCAKALAEARADGRKLSEPPGPDPSGWEEAYAIQDALIAMSDSAVVGWKIGATSKIAQERLGVDGPFSGPVFARWFTESPAEVATPAHALRIVEPEFALTLAADLPARDVAYSADEIAAAVKSLHPAFELIDRRITDQPGGKGGGGFTGSAYWFPADAGANAALILGPGIDNWRDLDVPALGVSVTVDGAAKTQGVAANAMGGPLTSLAWLVEHLRDRGIGLKAGQVITTGVVTDIFDLQPGQSAEATFEALGSISLDMGEY